MVRGGSGNLEELSAALRRSIGKLVKIQHGPATVSAEGFVQRFAAKKSLSFAGREGRADSDDAQVRRPASCDSEIKPGNNAEGGKDGSQGCPKI
jgi:hypothetical protein